VLAHPIRGQVYPTGITARFDFLFDHFFPIHPEFGLGDSARTLRLCADFCQVHFSVKGSHILPPFGTACRSAAGLLPAVFIKITGCIPETGRIAMQGFDFVCNMLFWIRTGSKIASN
jgi:hypothetical protein